MLVPYPVEIHLNPLNPARLNLPACVNLKTATILSGNFNIKVFQVTLYCTILHFFLWEIAKHLKVQKRVVDLKIKTLLKDSVNFKDGLTRRKMFCHCYKMY